MPNQARGVLARYGITRQEADRSVWAVDRDGRRREGAAALNLVLRELGGLPGALGGVLQIRPVAAVEAVAYRWFARNRTRFQRFGVRPECEDAASDCE